MTENRKGRQMATTSFVMEYENSLGQEAVDLYNKTGRTAQEWQAQMMCDIMAVNRDGLWMHICKLILEMTDAFIKNVHIYKGG